MATSVDESVFQPVDSSWAEFAQQGGLRAVIDPNDATGRRNAAIDRIQRLALERFAHLTEDAVVVDWGCGTGRMTRALAPSVRRVHGVDVTPEMLAEARATPGPDNVEYHDTDGLHVPLPDGSVDLVLSVCVLQYCVKDRETYQAVLREFSRMLRPGGRCLLIEQISPTGTTASDSVGDAATRSDYLAFGDAPLRLRNECAVRLGAPRLFERLTTMHRWTGPLLRGLTTPWILDHNSRLTIDELQDQPYVDWLFELEASE